MGSKQQRKSDNNFGVHFVIWTAKEKGGAPLNPSSSQRPRPRPGRSTCELRRADHGPHGALEAEPGAGGGGDRPAHAAPSPRPRRVRRRGVRAEREVKAALERSAAGSPAPGTMRAGEERPAAGGACGGASEVEPLKLRAAERIDEAAERLAALSRAIWSAPELAYEEHRAHGELTRFFQREPPAASWTVQPHYQLPTAFRAEWEPPGVRPAASPLRLGFLCEYDALPGIGHACGHNLIAEVGAAAALGVKGALETLPGPPPPVKVRRDPARDSTTCPGRDRPGNGRTRRLPGALALPPRAGVGAP